MHNWHEDARDLARHRLNVDSVDADAVVSIAIQLVENELQVHLLPLVDESFALLVLTLGVPSFILVPNIVVFSQFFSAILDSVEVLVQDETASHTHVALGSVFADATARSLVLLLAIQLWLKRALRVELQLVTLPFNLTQSGLLIHRLPVEAPTRGLARSLALRLGLQHV